MYPVVREKSGKFQEEIREKSGNIDSSQGKVKFSRKVREKSGNFMIMAVLTKFSHASIHIYYVRTSNFDCLCIHNIPDSVEYFSGGESAYSIYFTSGGFCILNHAGSHDSWTRANYYITSRNSDLSVTSLPKGRQ